MYEFILAFAHSAVLLAQDAASNQPNFPKAGATLGVGLAALGAGVAEGGIGAAAVGAIAEDRDFFGLGLIMTVLPETLVILALVVVFIV
ncbi:MULTISPECIES: F0F1 ATP synthase subunit C [unclassified Haladaptatus]|uniref:F0F1 ATP synthase subunit C n=1 Tax=unclassified Haladaptatus TaxID=2622732 RepID=UPI00209C06FE|nr:MULTISPECIES: F0F1 ATP synthase subunit C [unclassified Haladaptatus]MCO8242616.1 F0F1 ATP synthase subunit C [Haladaptatus sp. AB643]MCO8252375.1 F0F1 ATP synthase subunit C [Haladaptatus sp. AB618]